MRGVLIALHVLAVLVLSTPDLDGGLNRKAWKSDMVQAEFEAWTARFNRWGMDVTTEQVEQQTWETAVAWVDVRNKALTPFRPYRKYVGVRQRWRMFAAPNRVPARIRIAVEIDGQWQTVHEASSAAHQWRKRQLGHERLRVVINRAVWRHNHRIYARLLAWIVDAAAHDFPDATRVRVSFVRGPTPKPNQAESKTPTEVRVRVRDLAAAR